MSRQERYGTRDLAYSRWHRGLPDQPYSLDMIDLDGLEYCGRCRTPLALIEAVRDAGQAARKTTTVLERLAYLADLPALLVVYTTDGAEVATLTGVRLYTLPHRTLVASTPDGMAAYLYRLRHDHRDSGWCYALQR